MLRKKLLSLALALTLTLGLTLPALAAETAAVICLTKTTGTVEISKSSGKSVSLLKNMRLYNGYHVETDEESYAWINLDDSKLLKEDAASEVEVRKDGKRLEVLLLSGDIFFDVAEPLADDESMNIRTSTMALGVRGTSGWIRVVDRWTTEISVLEGTVECSVTDPVTNQVKAEPVKGGERVTCVVYPREQDGDKCDILREEFTVEDIPGFALTDLTRDIPLCDKIERETGLDIPRDLASVAGGDPSGRTPDRKSATKEVLDESDRREDADEADLREKLEELERERGPAEKRPDKVPPDKALPKPSGTAGTDKDGGKSSEDTPPPTPPRTNSMKLTDVQVQALLDAGSSVAVEPNTDASDATPKKNTLEVETGLTVASGKTLDLQSGIDVEVYSGKTLQVDGTLTADALTNNGTTTVTSGNTLRLRGNLTTAGTLSVTATGRIVVDGTFTRTGTLTLAAGARVLAKRFAANAAPSGWEVSAEADDGGYYSLVAKTPVTPDPPPVTPDPPAPKTYKITFSANGDSGTPAPMTTGPDGKLAAIPYFTPAGYEFPRFAGWFTAENLTVIGSQPIDSDTVFTSDTTVYARWFGWKYDAGTLTVAGSVMEDYINDSTGQILSRPWDTHVGDITNIVIQNGMVNIGDAAFFGCTNLQSVAIPSSVTSIGIQAFYRCLNLPEVAIPDSVTRIGQNAFGVCGSLTSVTIPSSVIGIESGIFSTCRNLTSIEVDPENPSYSSDGGVLFNKEQTTLVQVPSGLTGTYAIPSGVTSIGVQAFDSCSGLTNVIIPSGVTSIGIYAFLGCSGMTSVDIPDSVTSIGDAAFSDCSSLTTVTFDGTAAEWTALTSGKTDVIPDRATVYDKDNNPIP